MDDEKFNRFLSLCIKLANGTDANKVSVELGANAEDNLASKEEIVMLSVTAAIGARVNLTSMDASLISEIADGAKGRFVIDNRWNFTKLACAGHCFLHVSNTDALAEIKKAMKKRIGGSSIFSLDEDNMTVSKTRAKILLENKSKWGKPNVEAIAHYLVGTRFYGEQN